MQTRLRIASILSLSLLSTALGGCSKGDFGSGSSGGGTSTPSAASVSLSGSSLTFAAQPAGSSSAAQVVTVTNSGGSTLTLSSIAISGANASSFSQTDTCGSSIGAGASCTVSIVFAPAAAGSFSAAVTLADSAANSPQTVSLSGTGTAPAVALSPTSLTFSSPVGTASATQVVTLANTGAAPLAVSGITLGGASASSFTAVNTCGASVAAGANCSITLGFKPAATGSFAATVSIADNAPNSPQTIALTGTATTPAISLNSSALTFTAAAKTTSPTQVVLVTDPGTAPLIIGGVTLSGANASAFQASNSCSAPVAPGANCTVTVSFSPPAVGAYSASVLIADNVSGSPQTITLTGTGTAPPAPVISLSSSALSFTSLAEVTSAAQTVTLTNTGNAALSLASLTFTGTNAVAFAQTNTCGASVAAGASCTVSITFTPSIAASFSAGLALASNAAASPSTLGLSGTGTGTLTLNTSVSTDWKITNGAITLDFNPNTGNMFEAHLGTSTDELMDTTYTSAGQPRGLYSGNVGGGAGPITYGYAQVGNTYVDVWSETGSSATNPYSYTQHYIVTANDTGFHGYYVIGHSPTDIAGTLGQQQYIYRVNPAQFNIMYLADSGLQNLGDVSVPLPSVAVTGTTDPGRQVQNACVDITGLAVPAGWTRNFATKYDFSSYEYLHKAHGLYGAKYGSWAVFPSEENMIGGPSKQNLIFTENIVIAENLSSHYVVDTTGYTPPQGVSSVRLFGPTYFHFNAFSTALPTADAMYAEAQRFVPAFNFLYDNEATLLANNHVASTARGIVAPAIANGGSTTPNTAWTVLGDNATNFQSSLNGRQYFINNQTGSQPLTGVIPGTYRLSHYVLGQWGEIRVDNVPVTANQTTSSALNFTPENFGPAAPIWTIGTPDRSAHEFLHGHDAAGNDLRNFYGAYNYWADFAANAGAQVYYATAVGTTPATNDLSKINYVQWQIFDPGLFAGVYNAADDTTDGYKYIVPAYVGDPSTKTSPGATIHFTTTAAQQAQGKYAVLSIGIAAAEASLIATLNGHQLIWHYTNASDAMVRSGLSGYYQWTALQFDLANLSAPGVDNILTLGVSQTDGVMIDAMRFEITPNTADPASTGWHDYTYAYGSKSTVANDALPNNGN